ncbi:MAG TPA: PEP-CTERM sorting domain-containing protein [Armatimonadota bacterium]|nr:PEP-CTERM sorting domain-containing protein [Armatimonadota bacterium]
MRIVLTLVLVLVMAAGVTYAQGLQQVLTQPSADSQFVPDIVSNADSRPEISPVVATLTQPILEETPKPSNAAVICAHVVDSATRPTEYAPPLLPQLPSAKVLDKVYVVQPSMNSQLQVVPEPGSFLVLAVGLAGLASWRFRTRSH